jgi:rubrerythrin
MSATFNAGEVFEVAQQLERNGGLFYRRAAEAAETAAASRTLLELAVMEGKHQAVFAAMAEDLSPEERQQPLYDPNGEGAHYMRALAGGHVFDLAANPVDWLEGGRTTADVIRKAIQLEKDTIIYYLGIRDTVPAKLGAERIEDIIREEMGHITLLSEMLEAFEPDE